MIVGVAAMMTIVKWLLGIAVLAGLAAGGYWYLHAQNQRGPILRTEPVVKDELLATISATGTLEPEDVVDVGAQVAGQVTELGPDLTRMMPAMVARAVGLAGSPAGPGPLVAFPAALAVKRIQIDYRSVVFPGSVLARIDDRIYKARVEQLRAQVESSQAKLGSANANVKRSEADLESTKAKFVQTLRDWERARNLGVGQALTQQEYDQYRAAYESNKAGVGVSEAALEQAKTAVNDARAAVEVAIATAHEAELNLGFCTIRSDIQGVIIERRVTIGQTVQSSFNTPSLFLLALDLKRMVIWASVNEADIANVHDGQQVKFTVDAIPNETFEGTVVRTRLNASMTQNVVTYTVEVFVDNRDEKFKPYMTANLQFEVSRKQNVLLVPNAALRWRPQATQVAPEAREEFAKMQRKAKDAAGAGGAAPSLDKEPTNRALVWVQAGEFVRPVRIRTGLSDGNRTEVLQGDLKEGEQVVIGEAARISVEGGTTNPFAPAPFGGQRKQ